MSKKHKKVCTTLSYINHLLILVFTIPGCNWVFTFVFFLLGIPIAITSSAIGQKICVIAAGIKKYESIIKKKEKEAW